MMDDSTALDSSGCCGSPVPRRRLLAAALPLVGGAALGILPSIAYPAALTQARRDAMTPDDVIEMMHKGNERFRRGRLQQRDSLAEQRASATGQHPAAVILSCIDSRAPAERIMDLGIGDIFNARVAGNISNDDVLGSMEFACKLSGAKVVLVMGHTACGAIKGAIDNAELGNLTGLLAKIKPAVAATDYSGLRSAKNYDFVDRVAKKNVELTIDAIRRGSPVLASLETQRRIRIVGAMYKLDTGAVDFYT
jgi:carbonic anhydrase